MFYTKCNPSFIVKTDQLFIIQEMYPYGTYQYTDGLAQATYAFLEKQCANYPKDIKVISCSQHNGRGLQWAVILVQYPFWDDDWQIIGQYGHYNTQFVLFHRTVIQKKYFDFLERGELPKPVHRHGKGCLPDTDSLKDLLSCEVLA